MPTGIFEFQTMLTSAVNGISGALLGTEQSVSYVLMTICLVLGIYEAYTRGWGSPLARRNAPEVRGRRLPDRQLDRILFGCV